MIEASTRELVWRRADGRCEYCRLHQQYAELGHHIEHIVARQHGGNDDPENLALSCARCNLAKGPNLTGVDPETLEIVPLYHPRRDKWHEQFYLAGAQIVGRTPIGHATVRTLAMNERRRIELRIALISSGIDL